MIRCGYCGRFMSYYQLEYEAVTYTPYGGTFDLDPPEQVEIHGACWDKEHSNPVRGVTAWMGPHDNRVTHAAG